MNFDQTVNLHSIDVFYNKTLSGGGLDYNKFVEKLLDTIYPNKIFNSMYEPWCGPSFMGFNLLGSKKVNKLTISDIYQPALDACYKTVEHNNLDNVTIIKSDVLDNLNDLPVFDLIIANPPHFKTEDSQFINNPYCSERLYVDTNWEQHEKFYNGISKYMNEDSIIVMIENPTGSKIDYFIPMISRNKLYIEKSFIARNSDSYYLIIKKLIE